MTIQVYGYVRVSTTAQEISPEEQARRIMGRAMEQGWTIPDANLYSDIGVSGSIPIADRPAGRALINALRPGDVVIAAKLDRMFRSSLDALQTINRFRQQNIDLWLLDLGGSVTTDSVATLMLTILAAFAEYERKRIGERIKDAKANRARNNMYLGGSRPFGYHVTQDGTTIPNQNEQHAIAQAVTLRNQGLSLRQISAHLKLQGHDLSHVSVSHLLKREGRPYYTISSTA